MTPVSKNDDVTLHNLFYCIQKLSTKLNAWCILLRCQMFYGKLNKRLCSPDEEPVFPYS